MPLSRPGGTNTSPEDYERGPRVVGQAGLGESGDRDFGLLSEGERQQVLLARALMAEPELLLLDEPAAGLDLSARERLVTRLASLAADPGTPPMILVTHHTEEIPPGMTHAALMSAVTRGEGGTCRRSPDRCSTFGVLRSEGGSGHRRWSLVRPFVFVIARFCVPISRLSRSIEET